MAAPPVILESVLILKCTVGGQNSEPPYVYSKLKGENSDI